MANHIAGVAKLLGVEVGEVFREVQGMTECDIQAVLGCHYGIDKGQIVVPSVLLGSYEADFITITKSDYLIEVEIKISISDFRADFKKKHYHDCPRVNALYYALPKELYKKA